MTERDDLDELRRAWKDVEAPAFDRPLDEPDEATRVTIDWMRSAWSSLEPPPSLAARIGPAARPTPWRRWLPSAAAAALLVSVSLWVVRGPAVGPGEALVRSAESDPISQESRASGAVLGEGVRVAAIDMNRTELRSGPVRLVLLNGTNVHTSPDGLANDEVIR